MIRKVFALAAAAVVCLVGTAQAQGSADDGETVFKKCMTCHRIGPEAKNLIGPNLTGVIGRQAGTQEAVEGRPQHARVDQHRPDAR